MKKMWRQFLYDLQDFGSWLFSKRGLNAIIGLPFLYYDMFCCGFGLSAKLNLTVIYENEGIDYCPGIKSGLKKIIAALKDARRKLRICYFKEIPNDAHPLAFKLMLLFFPFLWPYHDRLPRKLYHIISPYGDTPEELAGKNVVDGTCPNVWKVINVAKKWQKLGYQVVFCGQECEWETRVVNAHIQNAGLVVDFAEGNSAIRELGNKIVLIAQTSFPEDLFERNLLIIRKSNPNAEVIAERTFCPVIQDRIKTAIRLSQKCELLIVVGDYFSDQGNYIARRLASCGIGVIRIDSPAQLDFRYFLNYRKVGVVAATSADKGTVLSIIKRLRKLRQSHCHDVAARRLNLQQPCHNCPEQPHCQKIMALCEICGNVHEACPNIVRLAD